MDDKPNIYQLLRERKNTDEPTDRNIFIPPIQKEQDRRRGEKRRREREEIRDREHESGNRRLRRRHLRMEMGHGAGKKDILGHFHYRNATSAGDAVLEGNLVTDADIAEMARGKDQRVGKKIRQEQEYLRRLVQETLGRPPEEAWEIYLRRELEEEREAKAAAAAAEEEEEP